MTTYDFDKIVNRRGTHCAKYDIFDEDVLPLWVADMDFPVAEPVVQALRERVDHAIFGYTRPDPALKDVLCKRMDDLYDWEVTPEQIVFLTGVVTGYKVAIQAFGQPGDDVLIQTPVYPPFLSGPDTLGQQTTIAELSCIQEGQRLRYEIDFEVFENAINERTKVFLLCSPHNPVGRVWRKDELTRMAEICLEHDMVICSDEIHCDLLSEGHPHIPIAALSPEIAKRTVTVMAPSKTFNLPSLGFAFAIIQDEELRKQYEAAAAILPHVGVMGYTGALAAYRDGQPWLDAVLAYLQDNRDFTTQFVEAHMPGVAITHPEGTYLSWLDCSDYTGSKNGGNEDEEDPLSNWIDGFFLKNARVALNAGKMFGENGDGFVRLNYACPRTTLVEGLQRIRATIEKH